jgi:hypothetical protein
MEQVKRHLQLEVLLRVDFTSLKMGTVWHSLSNKVIDAILRDFAQVRK